MARVLPSVSVKGCFHKKLMKLCIVFVLYVNGIHLSSLLTMVQALSNNHCFHIISPSHRIPPTNLLSSSLCFSSSDISNLGDRTGDMDAPAFLVDRTKYSSSQTTRTQLQPQLVASDLTKKQSKLPSQGRHRRIFLQSLKTSFITTAANLIMASKPALAEDVTATAPVEMKIFVDPKGLFALNIPKRFYAIRRTVKGDLPNEETGEGRRGSSIFTAGDMAKAEVVAVERFPITALLQTVGVTPIGDLSTFTSIGKPTAIASLIALRRDRDRPGQSRTILLPDSVSLSPDEKTLYFQLSTEVDVQKPELLMEQTGVGEIVRMTLAKATLTSADGQMMAVFASALKQDLVGSDGVALKEVVDSFVAMEQK